MSKRKSKQVTFDVLGDNAFEQAVLKDTSNLQNIKKNDGEKAPSN